MLIFNEASFVKFERSIRRQGSSFAEHVACSECDRPDDINRIEIKANEIAEEIGDSSVANMVMLGAYLKRADRWS